jgi:hypothetical protein
MLRQRDSLHQLHGEVPAVFIAEEFVQRHQIRMAYVAESAEFLFEQLEPARVEVG